MNWLRKTIPDSMATESKTVMAFLGELSEKQAQMAKVVDHRVGFSDGSWVIFYPEDTE